MSIEALAVFFDGHQMHYAQYSLSSVRELKHNFQAWCLENNAHWGKLLSLNSGAEIAEYPGRDRSWAYYEGVRCALVRLGSVDDCPYEPGTEAYADWIEGFNGKAGRLYPPGMKVGHVGL